MVVLLKWASLVAQMNPPTVWETWGLIPGLGRSPGGGHGNPLQYSCLGNPMDRGAQWATVCGVARSQTRLGDYAQHSSAHILWKYREFTVLCCFLMLSREMGLIPGWGRSLGEGNGNPLQYSCLENSMDRGVCQAIVHGVVKGRTQLSNQHVHFFHFTSC